MNAQDTVPCRPLPIKPARVRIVTRPDGTILMDQDYPVPQGPRSIIDVLIHQGQKHPQRTWIAKREALPDGNWGDWVRFTYGQALRDMRSVAQYMLDHGLGQDRSVLILTGPSASHATVAFAAMMVGAPVTSAPPAYAVGARDFSRLQHVVSLVRPGLILVDGADAYRSALSALPLDGVVVVDMSAQASALTPLADLLATVPTAAVDEALASLDPALPARYIFTSGSTGAPKAVVHTHGTLMAQIDTRDALLLEGSIEDGVVRMTWLPWNHTAGVIQLHYTIADAGSYYIDEGRPAQGAFAETLRNLQEMIPAEFTSTPILYERLTDALEKDPKLRHRFFRSVQYMTYASAALSDDLIDRIQTMARAEIGENLPFCTKYGSTETNSVLHSGRPLRRAGEIGIPYPGATIKLVPDDGRFELRVKGKMLFKGYLGSPEATAAAFDEEGFYRTGDAAAFIDPQVPGLGLMFDGRISENFKLSSGTWVSVGPLRTRLIEALSPLVLDAVIAGHDKPCVAILAWLRHDAAAEFCGLPAATPMTDLVADPRIRAYLADRLAAYNRVAEGSARRVAAILLQVQPPLSDEIVDKGYINQGRALRNRADAVKTLFATPPGPDLILATAD
ncbi:MAG: AMP-binding protein [Burkholderiaceae bacterium]|nr:AMP-binding protein [Burkholderiaceae bacterium]